MAKTRVTMYGIPNCDTIKKARVWLSAHGIDYDFHDYKTAGIDAKRLERWCRAAGWEVVLNRAGTTFRGLADAEKEDIDQKKAIALMLAKPSLIKRPVLEIGGRATPIVGFRPEIYAAAFRA